MRPPPVQPGAGLAPAGQLEAVLPRVVFLQNQSEDVRLDLAQLAICHNHPKGNLLFYRGDPSDAIYIVLTGRVKVSLIGEGGREVVLAVMEPGGVFGLVDALSDGPHTGTAVTLTDCELAKFSRERFTSWLQRHPRLQQAVLVELARMVREAYEKVGEQALMPVKQRLLAALLDIARADGKHTGKEVRFVRPTHQELAERVGSSREVVARLLKELLEEESLSAQGKVLHLPLSALVTREELRHESSRTLGSR